MRVSFAEVKKIVDELPLGLYCRRRIPLVIEEKTKKGMSYYSGRKDTITIDFSQVEKGLLNIPEENEEYTKEIAIRSMVYHELSHAILSPSIYARDEEAKSVINIFEDERIETILKDFYLDVDFKKHCLMANGGHIQENPANKLIAFYNLVRFRVCKEKVFLDRVENIIEEYKDINANTSDYYDYTEDIFKLYDDFVKAYEKDNTISNLSKEEKEDIENNISQGLGSGNGANENIEGQGKRNKTTKKNDNENSGNNSNAEENNGSLNAEESDNTLNTEESNDSEKRGVGFTKEDMENIFSELFGNYIDNNLTNTLDIILSNFNKKNKGGCGITSYSGVFNPRLVGNDNYKYFERSLATNGNNKFGKFHLNLFIDNSSSFGGNAKKVNTFIKSLETIEKRNKNFSFDVILCGDRMKETTKETRWVWANEGTQAEYDQSKNLMKKHNAKKDSLTYNILMYDGGCCWNKKNPFLAFDTNNTTIIVESGNFDNVKELKSAKVIKITDRTYTERFIDESIKAIANAFR